MDIAELIDQLQQLGEQERIEAKSCATKLGKSALESVCAFSNEPDLGGGYILLGVNKESDSNMYPASLVSPISENLDWYLDLEAAALL